MNPDMPRPKKFTCRACGATFDTDEELQAHNAKVHPKQPAKVAEQPPEREEAD